MFNRWRVCPVVSGEELRNMEDVKWDSLVIEINDYLEADEQLDGALKQVVELHLQVGQETRMKEMRLQTH